MDVYKFTLSFILCLVIRVNTEINDTNNETSDVTEISLCESYSNSCYTHSTELTTDLSFFSTVDNSSVVPKTTSAIIDNSTSISPTLVPEIKKKFKEVLERNCPCDITPSMCDINCCCDNDCNIWERSAFSTCIQFSPRPSVGQCLTTDIIYTNNTPYPTTRSVSGLLCISKDNFPERNAYIDQEVIRSVQIFERTWKRKIRFYWFTQEQEPVKIFQKTELYKYGDFLWKYTNSTGELQPIELPASTTSGLCQRLISMSYLKDFNSTCLRIAPKAEEECLENDSYNARSYCQDFMIVSSPSYLNYSIPLTDNPDDVFVKVKLLLCDDGQCNETSSYPEPFFDGKSSSCGNVLKEMNLIIFHNGSSGITNAICRVTLHSSLASQRLFDQNFKITYLPVHMLNTSYVFRRSGTPGYRTGLPVLIKYNKEDGIKANPLTVISGKNCDSYTSVLFRENMRIQCIFTFPINMTINCTSLEEHIIKKMLKGVGEVGVTGDPDLWLEPPFTLVAPLLPGSNCNPVSSLSLDFLYSYRGTFLKPEAKIVGLMSSFNRHKEPACSQMFCSLRLVTLVSFTDISRPVMSKYASAPVVKIKLPKDFFYPFSSSTASDFKRIKSILFYALSFSILLIVKSY